MNQESQVMSEEQPENTNKLLNLGQALRKKREAAGLELEDIALRIKISAKNLSSIEQGSQEGLPQPVFTRGFIRSYAQVLEMDKDEVETLLAQAFPEQLVNNINAERTTDAREQSVGINSQPPRPMLAIVGFLVLLALIGAGLWFYLSNSGQGRDISPAAENTRSTPAQTAPARPETASRSGAQAEAPAAGSGETSHSASLTRPDLENAAQADATALAAAGQAEANQAPAPENAAADAEPAATQPGQTAQAGQMAGQAAATQAGPATAPAAAQTEEYVRPRPGMQQVHIRVVSGSSWVGIQADTSIKRNFELRTGSTYRLEFRDKATVTLGNAAGVQITYNGRRIPLNAREGEVKILRFPPAG